MNAFWRVFAAFLLIVAAGLICLILFQVAVTTGLWPPSGLVTAAPTPVADSAGGAAGGSVAQSSSYGTAGGIGQLPVESGSMPIGGMATPVPGPGGEKGGGEPVVATLPAQETLIPPVTPDPCPPVAATGFTTGTLVYAVGQARLYTKPDSESPSVAEFSRGQALVVTPDLDGTTAITRCGTLWVLVQGPQGQIGWVLGAAVSIDPIPIDPIITPNPCPGGCATPVPTCTPVCPTPTCVQPCPNPCTLPCS